MTKQKQYTQFQLTVSFYLGVAIGIGVSFLALVGIGVVSAVAF